VLAPGGSVADSKRTVPLSRPISLRCGQLRPNRNHHCTLVIDRVKLRIARRLSLPCPPDRCFVNLVMHAHDRHARPRNVLVVGSDGPSGRIHQDKGRINALILGHDVPDSARRRTRSRARVAHSLPTGPARKKRVAYSVRLDGLRKGDRLTASARAVTSIGELPYNTYIGSSLILASEPTSVHPDSLAKAVASNGGHLDESNGFDCTHGASAFRNPCVTRKVGVLRIRRHPVQGKRSVPMYVNLVTRVEPLLTNPRAGGHARLLHQGRLTVDRYRP
jgi:hypothetical protein